MQADPRGVLQAAIRQYCDIELRAAARAAKDAMFTADDLDFQIRHRPFHHRPKPKVPLSRPRRHNSSPLHAAEAMYPVPCRLEPLEAGDPVRIRDIVTAARGDLKEGIFSAQAPIIRAIANKRLRDDVEVAGIRYRIVEYVEVDTEVGGG